MRRSMGWVATTMAALAAFSSFQARAAVVVSHSYAARTSNSPAAAGTSTKGCPNASGCGLYALKSGRWPASKGLVTIPFSINPLQTWMSGKDAEGAVLAATATWGRANSAVRFKYLGRTRRLPVAGDGFNDIGWDHLEPGILAAATITSIGSRIVEADIVFNILMPWKWTRCTQQSGACVDAPADAGMIARFQAQAVATHEVGHWVGLADLTASEGRDLTMYEVIEPGERKQATLALGDIKGTRAAYPCGRCRMPAIVKP